jgi:hypothetical protein
MCRAIFVLSLLAVIAGSNSPAVVAASDLREEASFVQAHCGCHATDQSERASPYEGAVPFAELARNPAVSALALRVMLQTSHRTMPNLSLTPEQTAMVVAYILGLRGGSPSMSRGLTQINDRIGSDGQDY